MDSANASAKVLRQQIVETEAQLKRLKDQLSQVEAALAAESVNGPPLDGSPVTEGTKWPLSAEEYKRYGRQMIVPSIGIQGDFALKLR